MPQSIDEGNEFRGDHQENPSLFYYMSLESMLSKSQPLQDPWRIVDDSLNSMAPARAAMHASVDPPSVTPERRIRASLLQVFYSVPSEGLLVDQFDYNLLFAYFIGFGANEVVWDMSTFSKNPERFTNANCCLHCSGRPRIKADVADCNLTHKILDLVEIHVPPRPPPRYVESHQVRPDLFAQD